MAMCIARGPTEKQLKKKNELLCRHSLICASSKSHGASSVRYENERNCPTDNQIVISGCPPKFLVVRKLLQSETTTCDQQVD